MQHVISWWSSWTYSWGVWGLRKNSLKSLVVSASSWCRSEFQKQRCTRSTFKMVSRVLKKNISSICCVDSFVLEYWCSPLFEGSAQIEGRQHIAEEFFQNKWRSFRLSRQTVTTLKKHRPLLIDIRNIFDYKIIVCTINTVNNKMYSTVSFELRVVAFARSSTWHCTCMNIELRLYFLSHDPQRVDLSDYVSNFWFSLLHGYNFT